VVEASPTTVHIEVEGLWIGPSGRRLRPPQLMLDEPGVGKVLFRALEGRRGPGIPLSFDGTSWTATYAVPRRVAVAVASEGDVALRLRGGRFIELDDLPPVDAVEDGTSAGEEGPRARRRGRRRDPRQRSDPAQRLVLLGAIVVGLAAAAFALRFIAPRPGIIPGLVAASVAGMFLLGRPRWILPVFVAFTWAQIGQAAFGGLSPDKLGAIALFGVAVWRVADVSDRVPDVVIVMLLLGLPLVASALVSNEAPGLPSSNLRDLLFIPVVALTLRSFDDMERMNDALVVGGIILGAGAVFSVLVHPTGLFQLQVDTEGTQAARAAGPFGEANFFALSLAALTPFAMHSVYRGGWRRPVGIAAGVALIAGIFATGSRGALIATAAGLIVLALGAGRGYRIGVVAIIVMAAIVYPFFGQQSSSSSQRTIGGRLTENRIAVAMFESRPLVGVGPKVYSTLYHQYSRRIGNDPRIGRRAHSLPLEIAAEQGLAGILGWLGMLGMLVWTVLTRHLWRIPVARTVVVSVVVFMTGSLFLHGDLNRILYMLVGAIIAAGSMARFSTRAGT
jgi:hypothetical protein